MEMVSSSQDKKTKTLTYDQAAELTKKRERAGRADEAPKIINQESSCMPHKLEKI